jgi:hypothetical protein
MTVEELLAREAIRDTMAQYNTSGDRLKVDDYVACFTDDAVMESEYVPEDRAFRYAGKPAIRAWQMRWLHREPGDAVHKATFIRHHLSTSKIDLTGPDTAKARTYWVAWTDIGPDHAGYYLDDFRKEGDRWLIARRRVRIDWESPASLYRSAVSQTNG